MKLPIVIYGDPVLREKGRAVTQFDAELVRLAEQMLATMHECKGIGLAAQQVGRALQFAVIDVRGVEDRPSSLAIDGVAVDPEQHMPLYLINATVEGTKSKDVGEEGCLSFPGLRVEVPRARRVKVRSQRLDGSWWTFEAGGLLGIAIQHEMDHLQGKLFIDYMTPEERRAKKRKLEAIVEQRGAAAAT